MGIFAKIANQIFGYNTENVPASGWREPDQEEIIPWGTAIERLVSREPREVTAAGSITVDPQDTFIAVNKTVGAATSINLCAADDYEGDELTIIDAKGDASTNVITIDGDGTETISGSLSVTVLGDGGVVKIKPNAERTGWYLTQRT
jgi:hypothetical protein